MQHATTKAGHHVTQVTVAVTVTVTVTVTDTDTDTVTVTVTAESSACLPARLHPRCDLGLDSRMDCTGHPTCVMRYALCVMRYALCVLRCASFAIMRLRSSMASYYVLAHAEITALARYIQ